MVGEGGWAVSVGRVGGGWVVYEGRTRGGTEE